MVIPAIVISVLLVVLGIVIYLHVKEIQEEIKRNQQIQNMVCLKKLIYFYISNIEIIIENLE